MITFHTQGAVNEIFPCKPKINIRERHRHRAKSKADPANYDRSWNANRLGRPHRLRSISGNHKDRRADCIMDRVSFFGPARPGAFLRSRTAERSS